MNSNEIAQTATAEILRTALDDHLRVFRAVEALEPEIGEVASRMIQSLQRGGKVCWMGNGGSAADCQHLAAELVGRFVRERKGYASIAFTTDTSILTAIGNDYGYEQIFSRQIEGLCRPGDVLVGITTSGNSPNILAGMKKAAEIGGIYRVGMTGGDGGALKDHSETLLTVPGPITARVQEAHIFIGHVICDLVEGAIAGELAFP